MGHSAALETSFNIPSIVFVCALACYVAAVTKTFRAILLRTIVLVSADISVVYKVCAKKWYSFMHMASLDESMLASLTHNADNNHSPGTSCWRGASVIR